MTLSVEVLRTEIDDQYSVLEYLPLPQAVETLKWVTNVFVAADLSETRRSLADYPAITISYSFVLQPKSDPKASRFFEELASSTTAKNVWVLPYFPHMTQGWILRDGGLAVTSVGGGNYPYDKYCCIYNRERMVYRKITSRTGNSSTIAFESGHPITEFGVGATPNVFVVPCFLARIASSFNYSDVGVYRYGGKIMLSFRMLGDSERAMTYHVDDFDFVDALQAPLKVTMARRQANFAPPPAPANVYTPNVYMKNQTPIVNANYWLNYDNYTRQDYFFRGAMMKRLGSFTSDYYVSPRPVNSNDSDIKHRIEDDTVRISYDLGVAKATVRMRQLMRREAAA